MFDTPEAEAIRDRVYPYYLADVAFRVPGFVAIAVLLSVFYLLAKYGWPAWEAPHQPSSHPLITRAKRWPDPIATAAAARQEVDAFRFEGGAGWRVTDRFLIQSSFFSFDILRIADLLWAYKKVTQHSVNFIPTRKTYDVVLVCYGGTAVIPTTDGVGN